MSILHNLVEMKEMNIFDNSPCYRNNVFIVNVHVHVDLEVIGN